MTVKLRLGLTSIQARPGRNFEQAGRPVGLLAPGHRELRDTRLKARRAQPWNSSRKRVRGIHGVETQWYSPIYGLTGVLFFPSYRQHDSVDESSLQTHVFFDRHRADSTGDLSKEPLGLDELFWLAVGCLSGSTNNVLCLDDVESLEREPNARQVLRNGQERHLGMNFDAILSEASAPLTDITPSWGDGRNSSDSSQGSFGRRAPPMKNPYLALPRTRTGRHSNSPDNGMTPRTFQLAILEERLNMLSQLSEAVKAEDS